MLSYVAQHSAAAGVWKSTRGRQPLHSARVPSSFTMRRRVGTYAGPHRRERRASVSQRKVPARLDMSGNNMPAYVTATALGTGFQSILGKA